MKKTKLVEYVIDTMEQEMNNLVGWRTCSDSLVMDLFMSQNVDGSFLYNTYATKEWIKEHFDDLGEWVEEINKEYDYMTIDPFNESEQFMTMVVIYIAECLVQQSKPLNDFANEIYVMSDKIVSDFVKDAKQYDTK